MKKEKLYPVHFIPYGGARGTYWVQELEKEENIKSVYVANECKEQIVVTWFDNKFRIPPGKYTRVGYTYKIPFAGTMPKFQSKEFSVDKSDVYLLYAHGFHVIRPETIPTPHAVLPKKFVEPNILLVE